MNGFVRLEVKYKAQQVSNQLRAASQFLKACFYNKNANEDLKSAVDFIAVEFPTHVRVEW